MIAVGRRTKASATPDRTTAPDAPADRSPRPDRRLHSLADGGLGEAMLALELALTGDTAWDEVDDMLAEAIERPADHTMRAGLYYGAPAVLFALDATGVDGRARYAAALAELDPALEHLTQERLEAARERAGRAVSAAVAEFDLFSGLTGLGTLLLRRAPRSRVLHEVVAYVVGLTHDRMLDGVRVPGWWATDADPSAPARGSANLGMAQGAAGLLAFLATAARAGQTVEGHRAAIGRVAQWLGQWRQEGPDGVWWPQQLTLEELRSGEVREPGPSSPSWAYGTPGIGRALQMAAIAVGDPAARGSAEHAIASCLTRRQLDRMAEPDLYTGTAGLYQTVFRAAQDAGSPILTHRLATAADALSRTGRGWPEDTAFLTGRSGTRLANQTLFRGAPPVSGWDRALQIGWAHV